MLSREEKRKIQKSIGKIQKKLNKEKFKCIIPNCNEYAISSHSQQKEGQLRSISENGLVYAIDRNIYDIIKNYGYKPALRLKKIGIAEVSTFPGFCAKHDRELFKNIELKPLELNNPEQSLLLYLRSYSYEYLQKLRMRIFLGEFLKECHSILGKEKSLDIEAIKLGMDHFVDDEAPIIFNKIFTALYSKDFSIVDFWWKVINKNIKISSSCCFSPLFDKFHTHRIDHWNEPQPVVSFNLIPMNERTYVILVWLKEFSDLMSWIKKYNSSNSELETLINHCAFAESEDTCINITLWDKTDNKIKLEVLNAMRHYLFRGPLEFSPKLIEL